MGTRYPPTSPLTLTPNTMASRIAKGAMGAARAARPTLPMRTLAPASTSFATSAARFQENKPAAEPKDTANSNELLVINEESIIAVSLLTIYWAVYNYAGPAYREWALGQADKFKNILNSARKDHTDAVKSRMSSVQDLSGVIDVTKNLFAVSKETAQLEAQAYDLEQKTALAHEAKSVLDSWVRYEGQVKARQQRELAETVIGKIDKELENPKVLDQILKQSIADVERIVSQQKA